MLEFAKEFKFLSQFCYRDQRLSFTRQALFYANRIFWNGKVLFATDGKVFIWTDKLEENPEGFSVWKVKDNKFIKEQDIEELKRLQDCKLDERILKRINASKDIEEFIFKWDFSLPLPMSNRSKTERWRDRSHFDLEHNKFVIKFKEGTDKETIENYEGLFNYVQENKEKFNIPYWIVEKLVKSTKKTKESIVIRVSELGYNKYCTLYTKKWTCVTLCHN